MLHQNEGEHKKNEGNPSPMVHYFEGKNEYMNSIPSNLREHYSQRHFDVKLFYLHNGPLHFDNLYFMHKQTLTLNITFITLYQL